MKLEAAIAVCLEGALRKGGRSEHCNSYESEKLFHLKRYSLIF
jgi:hypothetical protein